MRRSFLENRKKHRHAKRTRVIFFVINAFIELFTIMIGQVFFGITRKKHGIYDVHMMLLIGNGKIAK